MAYGDQRAAERGLQFGPAPEGFDMSPVSIGDRDPGEISERGVAYLLSSTRVDATTRDRVFTSRLVQQVTASDGLQPAASFEASFNPSYERLVIHAIRVWRGGVMRDAAMPEAFELFRRELNLERAVYDGRLTAHMIAPDVRVGDVVDTVFSIIGGHPVLNDSLAFSPRLQFTVPTVETRVELRTAADRPLTIRTFGKAPRPSDTVADGVRTLVWRARDTQPYRHEADAPPWYVGNAALFITDAIQWPQVSALFRGFYDPPARLPETLEAAVQAIAAAEPTAAGRTAEGLRFVQGALRYHSVGVGDGGFRPRPVETIWDTRYGDCKDASRLLTAVLRRLGVEAAPALVNTRIGPDLEKEAPNATAFDHCIVRAVVDGGSWWLDPTSTPQAGDLAHLTLPRHGWALPLVEGGTLERMREGPIPTVCETLETWTFDRTVAMPARLELKTVYRDWRADDMRRWLANDGPRSVSRRFRELLEQDYGQVVEAAPLAVTDDRTENRLELVELYDVDKPFQTVGNGLRFLSRDDVVGANLRHLDTARRGEPIDMGQPRRVVTERVFNLPVPLHIAPWSVDRAGPATFLKSTLEWRSKRQVAHVLALTVTRRVVTADEAQDHFAFLRQARDLNGVSFGFTVEKGKMVGAPGAKSGGEGSWRWLIWAVIIVGIVLARLAALGG